MENIKWENLIRATKYEGTILFIGPNLEKDENGNCVFAQLCNNLVDKYKENLSFDKNEGFFFFNEPKIKMEVLYDINEFYEKKTFSSDIYKKIAAIPFHLIISLNPNHGILNIFEEYNVKNKFAFFDSYKNEVEKPTMENPLIYNLFGLPKHGKYILTQEDYYNYIKSVIGDDVLPRKIVSSLSTASNFIFIGFDFDKWYIRLLLLILNFHLNRQEQTRHAVKQENTNLLFKNLVEKQFNITFIENEDLNFINIFYNEIKKAGMSKKLISKQETLEIKIKEKQKLLAQYENTLITENDPKDKLRLEKEIDNLKFEIENLRK
jgi:hypothetical protein